MPSKCTIGATLIFPLAVEVAPDDGRVMSVHLPNTDDAEAAKNATLYVVCVQKGVFLPDVYGPFFTPSSAAEKMGELKAKFPDHNVYVEPCRKD